MTGTTSVTRPKQQREAFKANVQKSSWAVALKANLLIVNWKFTNTSCAYTHFFTTASWCCSRCRWLTYILALGGKMLFSRLWTSLPIMASNPSKACRMSHAFRRGRTIGKPIAHLTIWDWSFWFERTYPIVWYEYERMQKICQVTARTPQHSGSTLSWPCFSAQVGTCCRKSSGQTHRVACTTPLLSQHLPSPWSLSNPRELIPKWQSGVQRCLNQPLCLGSDLLLSSLSTQLQKNRFNGCWKHVRKLWQTVNLCVAEKLFEHEWLLYEAKLG